MPQYIISTRAIKGGAFIAEPMKPVGKKTATERLTAPRARFLKVPDGKDATPEHVMTDADAWFAEVRDHADGDFDGNFSDAGDVLIFVHGYNNDIPIIRKRHERLQQDLKAEGWRGLVVSFDWPSDDATLNYWEDRSDAAATAKALVTQGIRRIAAGQRKGCQTNVHLLGHSTGAYVIMEAFVQAEKDGDLFRDAWRVGQVAFIGGDVGADSLRDGESWSQPLFRRIMRLTNYSSGCDFVLSVSNAKRLGSAPRAGRIGLPATAPRKAVNVDCTRHFNTLDPKQSVHFGTFAHSWHIGDRVFARDLALTLDGRIDREHLPTRAHQGDRLVLQAGERPKHYAGWASERSAKGVE